MNNGKWEYWGKSLKCVCMCIKLKNYSGIQETNFLFLLQVFFFRVILAEGYVLPKLYVVLLCFVEESMKNMNSYV